MKTVEELYQEMASAFAEETGAQVSVNGDLAVRLYAVAAQLYTLYVQGEWVVRQCFPQTAEGEYLDLHAQLRGLERKQAERAEGTVRFSAGSAAGSDLTIPEGTVCMTAGQVRFETTQAGVLEAGETSVDIPARAVEPGLAGNVAAGAIVTMAVPPVGIAQCLNPEGFSGGADQEGDEELRARVLESFRRLPNGANAAYYEQEAMSFPEVAAVQVLPRSRGVGTVDVVVATRGGVPDEDLLEELEEYFQARREIAVDVGVLAPETVTVPVTAKVRCAPGQDAQTVIQRVKDRLQAWFSGELLGQDVLLARLNSLIFETEGVANCALTAPAADVTVERDQLPVLGTLTVEEWTET